MDLTIQVPFLQGVGLRVSKDLCVSKFHMSCFGPSSQSGRPWLPETYQVHYRCVARMASQPHTPSPSPPLPFQVGLCETILTTTDWAMGPTAQGLCSGPSSEHSEKVPSPPPQHPPLAATRCQHCILRRPRDGQSPTGREGQGEAGCQAAWLRKRLEQATWV